MKDPTLIHPPPHPRGKMTAETLNSRRSGRSRGRGGPTYRLHLQFGNYSGHRYEPCHQITVILSTYISLIHTAGFRYRIGRSLPGH